jgi:DnaJ-class molecular chaperone
MKLEFMTFPEWVHAHPELVEEFEDEKTVKCTACNGTGEISCQCDCGDVHEKDCEECDGDGEISSSEIKLKNLYRQQLAADKKKALEFGVVEIASKVRKT